jgi:2-dehydrotetronate isomerase
MPRFSANLGFLFADRPLPKRIEAAAAAGFPAIELHWPYDVPAAEIRAAIDWAGVAMLNLNMPVGGAGEFGLGALPGREGDFEAAFETALSYGEAIGASAVHCLAGLVEDGAAAEAAFVGNLRSAADKAARAGMTILIEPMNPRDRPGYLLSRVEQAAAIVAAAERRNVRIMFDAYHVQITQGDLTHRLETHLPLVGHIQIAAVPDRGEPDSGEIDFEWLCGRLDRAGYAGFVGAEYQPRGRTEDGLGWLRAFGS